jgi:hypothetical protein
MSKEYEKQNYGKGKGNITKAKFRRSNGISHFNLKAE